MEEAQAATPRTAFGRWCANLALYLQTDQDDLCLLVTEESGAQVLASLQEGKNVIACVNAAARTLDFAIKELHKIALTHREAK